jgi:hypothetical protein
MLIYIYPSIFVDTFVPTIQEVFVPSAFIECAYQCDT